MNVFDFDKLNDSDKTKVIFYILMAAIYVTYRLNREEERERILNCNPLPADIFC